MSWLCLHGLDSIFWRFAAVVSQRHQHLMLLLLVLVTTCGINYYTLLLHVVVSTSRSVAATYVLTTTSQQNHRIRQPSIVFILADDLGFNDVPWNNPKLHAPNLAKLAARGIRLAWFYGERVCSPSRAALMTGKYPYQGNLLSHSEGEKDSYGMSASGLRTRHTLLPEYLKREGYITHMVGKWHLGFCNESYLPTRRGFQTFYGFLNHGEDYFNHTWRRSTIYDFFQDEEVDYSAFGKYSTTLFTSRARQLIRNHAIKEKERPFFLYVAYQNIHGPLTVPPRFLKGRYEPKNRRELATASISALDEGIGEIVESLEENGLTEDTLVVFASDNGGSVCSGGNNFPLRGHKWQTWEGGNRVPAVVVNPLSQHTKGTVYDGLFHMSDWLPTLLSAARIASGGGVVLDDVDGVDQWESLTSNLNHHPRKELLQERSLRVGDLKLVRLGNSMLADINSRVTSVKWQESNIITLNNTHDCNKWRKSARKIEVDDPSESTNLLLAKNNDKEQQHQLAAAKRLLERKDELYKFKTPWKFSLPETMELDGKIHLNWCTAIY